jgi:ABC-type cobalt transport system substrate-binding protein
MKKGKMIVALMLVFILAASCMYGCADKKAETSPPASEALASVAPASEAPASEAPASEAPASEARTDPPGDPNHEVYSLMEENMVPWQGLDTTAMETSRAAIDKAIAPDNRKDDVTVGYITWNNSTPFFAASEQFLKEQCESWGYKFMSISSNGDINAQVAGIESLVTAGVDIIIDCDYVVESELSAVETAVAAGVPVIGYAAGMSRTITRRIRTLFRQRYPA